jgi:large subunit ribosomal protein L5
MAKKKYQPRLQVQYQEKVLPAMMEKFKYSNIMQVPKLEKISLNMGLGQGVQDSAALEKGAADLAMISGQKPTIAAAKKSISNFKLRQGMKNWCFCHFARCSDVRISGSLHCHCRPAHSRFSRFVG